MGSVGGVGGGVGEVKRGRPIQQGRLISFINCLGHPARVLRARSVSFYVVRHPPSFVVRPPLSSLPRARAQPRRTCHVLHRSPLAIWRRSQSCPWYPDEKDVAVTAAADGGALPEEEHEDLDAKYEKKDIFSLPGALLLLFRALQRYIFAGGDDQVEDDYMPLNRESNTSSIDSDVEVTPLATAGFLSRIYFWWLNPLMVKGGKKPLGDKDIPQLRFEDRAESCYSVFMEQLNRRMQADQSSSPSILWTIVACHKREILVSGFFALLKIATLAAGPLLLKAFIRVAEGEESFKYEGFVLAFAMFFSKCIESLAQRQKQLRLSGAAKKMHSSGEIMNYVTMDAYRIGEFPYWFHQTWTTSLQLIIALGILYNVVGLATISAVFVIVLTVLCNTPLAKLQNKFQTKLIEAQDERLKAMSEALINMKVLKLYAWDTHFKMVIEALRKDPVRSIPDILGVVIQVKVAFSQIMKFLEAPELQGGQPRQKVTGEHKNAISIKSCKFSWEEKLLKPTLQNIDLEVKCGEKVANVVK
ncbi:ABC transporter C family member 10 [Acorus calamus]|uniref:ABC transporter C family member 10 n=1 Tax=Acorus calamus TaxID=4465 RepID=A0AAV9BX90_ACOCL|nr:ABC transporter C family member 10 [Acorus calamus]